MRLFQAAGVGSRIGGFTSHSRLHRGAIGTSCLWLVLCFKELSSEHRIVQRCCEDWSECRGVPNVSLYFHLLLLFKASLSACVCQLQVSFRFTITKLAKYHVQPVLSSGYLRLRFISFMQTYMNPLPSIETVPLDLIVLPFPLVPAFPGAGNFLKLTLKPIVHPLALRGKEASFQNCCSYQCNNTPNISSNYHRQRRRHLELVRLC